MSPGQALRDRGAVSLAVHPLRAEAIRRHRDIGDLDVREHTHYADRVEGDLWRMQNLEARWILPNRLLGELDLHVGLGAFWVSVCISLECVSRERDSKVAVVVLPLPGVDSMPRYGFMLLVPNWTLLKKHVVVIALDNECLAEITLRKSQTLAPADVPENEARRNLRELALAVKLKDGARHNPTLAMRMGGVEVKLPEVPSSDRATANGLLILWVLPTRPAVGGRASVRGVHMRCPAFEGATAARALPDG